MYISNRLLIANLLNRPSRSSLLVSLIFFLSVFIFVGVAIIIGLNKGLDNFSKRLGADIIVVPYKEALENKLDGVLLQGKPGSFYMSDEVLDTVKVIPNIESFSPQFYLASLESDCCSSAVQLIGYDPNTDFVITPWLSDEDYPQPQNGEVVVGNNIFVSPNNTVRFYGQELKVVGRLHKTGSDLDSAVYCNVDTIKLLLNSAIKLGLNTFSVDPDKSISSVLVNVKNKEDISKIAFDINSKVKGVRAVKTQDMISGFYSNIRFTSVIISALALVIWLLSFVIMFVVYTMIANERRKEFSILRVVGVSKRALSLMLIKESTIISLVGAVTGVVFSVVVLTSFRLLIEDSISAPFILMNFTDFSALGLTTVITTIIAGVFANSYTIIKATRSEIGYTLREAE